MAQVELVQEESDANIQLFPISTASHVTRNDEKRSHALSAVEFAPWFTVATSYCLLCSTKEISWTSQRKYHCCIQAKPQKTNMSNSHMIEIKLGITKDKLKYWSWNYTVETLTWQEIMEAI